MRRARKTCADCKARQTSKDNVIGPWWVSFEAMLSQELRDEIGLSEDRGATLCITRVCAALLEAREPKPERTSGSPWKERLLR